MYTLEFALNIHGCSASVDLSSDRLYSSVVKAKVLVAQLCLTLCNPKKYSPPGSSVHGSFQARILEWVVFPFSRGSS